MWVSKKELEKLSDFVRDRSVEQEDIRDNKEGALSRLKNDIYTLVDKQNEQLRYTEEQRDILSGYMADISHQLKTPITSTKRSCRTVRSGRPTRFPSPQSDTTKSKNVWMNTTRATCTESVPTP